MAFLIGGANSAADTGYNINNSLRFDEDTSPYLSQTFGSAGNRKTWTISFWMKMVDLDIQCVIWKAAGANNDVDHLEIAWGGGTTLNIGGWTKYFLITSRLFRDHSAWYHIVLAVDTTDSTADDRMKLYVNGVQETSFITRNNPDEDADMGPLAAIEHKIGNDATSTFDGYIADMYVIDGTRYAASDFGEFDEDSGIWKPKDASGLTFGTNGFFLEFKQSGTSQNASGLGADTSGNDKHWAVTNLAATDQCTDTPTNNFAILNSLAITNSDSVLSEGSTVHKVTGGNAWIGAWTTLGAANGKWYAEIKVIADNNTSWGVIQSGGDSVANFNTDNSGYVGKYADGWGWWGNATAEFIHNNSGSAYGTEEAEDDIFMIAVDIDGGKWWIGKNGTWFDAPGTSDTGDPANGNYPGIGSISFTDFVHFASGLEAADSDDSIVAWNFGNPSFAISSGNADANGYGNFEYAPPSGFYALCTKNLAEFG